MAAIALYPDPMSGALGDALAVGTLLFSIALGWCAARLRCPRCCKPVLWHLMKHSSVNRWFADILTARSCPICDYTPTGRVGS